MDQGANRAAMQDRFQTLAAEVTPGGEFQGF